MSRRNRPKMGGAQFQFPPLSRTAIILIAVNAALWAVSLVLYYAAPETLTSVKNLFELQPDKVLDGYVFQLFTYMFLHEISSPFHVLMNMLLVYFFAGPLQRRWGVRKTIGFAIGAGLAGGVMVMLFHFASLLLGFGAGASVLGFSGAALGMLAAFCWIQPEAVFWPIPIKAKYMIPIAIGIDFVIWIAPGSDISFAAHLGGILFGTLVMTDGWMPKSLLYRFRYWRIRKELDKRKGGKDNVVKGPWLH